MRKFSVIIPVFNRPDEIDELLGSLVNQTYKEFEVLVIDDGSDQRSESITGSYKDKLNLRYFYKENSGQGFTRNFGYERAEGDYFVVFDSDCIIPPRYLEVVNYSLDVDYLDAYGGPDRDHQDFTMVQKAINYAMTSIYTTGGTRGSKKHIGHYHPRSFNMGISKEVFEKTNGYILPKMGEDIEFSIRIIKNGFKTGLIKDAFVYHKRRANFIQFFKQLHFFGRARINVSRYYPKELRLFHAFPALFLLGLIAMPILFFLSYFLFELGAVVLSFYFSIILIDATVRNRSLFIGALSVLASFIQFTAYGVGFIKEGTKKLFE